MLPVLMGVHLTINFDTLALVKHLEKEGAFTRAQAESLAEGLDSAVGAEVATKTDLKALENVLRSDMKALENGLRSDMKALENGLRSDINGLNSDMKALGTALRLEMQVLDKSLKFWVGGMVFAAVSVLSGVMTFLFRVFAH